MHVRRLKLFFLLACLMVDFGDPSSGVFSFEAKELFTNSVVTLSKPAPTRLARAHRLHPSQGTDETKSAEAYKTQRSNPALRHVGRAPERRYQSGFSDPPPSSPDAH